MPKIILYFCGGLDYNHAVRQMVWRSNTRRFLMRSIFFALAIAVSVATTYAGTPTPADDTASVLKTTTAQSAPAPVVQATDCEEARVVKIAPWQVRRLNRVADRQEVREAKNCCKDSCSCKDDCCQKPKTLVLESRRKEKCDCCCK